MRLIILLLLITGGCCSSDASIIISEFCPDPYIQNDADEYIVLSGEGMLDGITISDGKGGFRFPKGTRIDGTRVIARSGSAYKKSHGQYPDFEWLDSSPAVPDVIPGDPLRLANNHDMILVYENGNLIQNITWPGDVRPREGQIHYLEKGVWDPRPLMLGQSRFLSYEYPNVTVTTFVAPDSSADMFTDVVDGARNRILLNVYEFSSPAMTESLVAARKRDVDVTVLVEGGPVGGISREEKSALWAMNRSGIPVYAMIPSKGEHAPYRYDHAKYLVIDNRAVVVTSENFKGSGFPPKGASGNRGWGVFLEDANLASYFTAVFTHDLNDPSVKPYSGVHGDPEPAPSGSFRPGFFPERYTGATVRPVIAPDTSREIENLINSASTSIEIQQAYITNESEVTLNPYLSAAINASRRGVRVKVLLDSYWYNTEDTADNDEMAALINGIAKTEHLPLEARCADLATTGISKIHNKGVIVDDRKVLVSSINWNSNSPNFNREAGVIIEHPGVAGYFRKVFDTDWAPSVTGKPEQTDSIKIAVAFLVIVLLLSVYYRRHIR